VRFGGLIFLRGMKLNYSTSVLEPSRHAGHLTYGTDESDIRESPNSSGALSRFASGSWYADTAGCFLQGDVRTKVKTPGAGEIW
jgi:hypothetical protein